MRGKEEFRDELFELAICDFERNLKKFRKLYPVKTICMHGSPLSKWDNRDLWKRYDYRDFGIIAEPYFDLDFREVFYLTDTGRAWNNSKVSVRDKVETLKRGKDEGLLRGMNRMNRMIPAGLDGTNKRDEWTDPFGGMNRMDAFGGTNRMNRMGSLAGTDGSGKTGVRDPQITQIARINRKGTGVEKRQRSDVGGQTSEDRHRERTFGNLRFRSTFDIIEAVENGLLPDKIMINTHPQRWTDKPLPWVKELVWQNFKNVIKKYFYVRK